MTDQHDGVIDIAAGCCGSGSAPNYRMKDNDGRLELVSPGDLYSHADGMLGFSALQPDGVEQFDAFLETGCYDLRAEAIPVRVPASVIGRRPGFGNPNGEFPMSHGTNIRFRTNGFRVGAPNPGSHPDGWVDQRMSLPMICNIGLYQDPEVERPQDRWAGAAIWLDMVHDSTTIYDVRVARCTFGLLSTCFTDTFKVRNLHTAGVDFPVYFAGDDDESLPGETIGHWANTLSDCCFADGNGPCVVKQGAGFDECSGWQFNNIHIVRQGRRSGVRPETCNLYWLANGGQIRGGVIKDPGFTLPISDGGPYRVPAKQIEADGMVLGGSRNTISTVFLGASGKGRANLRLLPGAHENIIQSSFLGAKEGAVDLVIPAGCERNVVYCYPGMTIHDEGCDTQYIGGGRNG